MRVSGEPILMMMTDPENLCAESRVKAFGLQGPIYLDFHRAGQFESRRGLGRFCSLELTVRVDHPNH